MIQRLKEFNFTHPVTDAISVGIMHIMNDRIASSVVLYCLEILDSEQNQVLKFSVNFSMDITFTCIRARIEKYLVIYFVGVKLNINRI